MSIEAELDALAQIERDNPVATFLIDPPGPGKWGAAPWQRELLHDPCPQISLLGANDVGKSTALAAVVWSFLLDQHPVWRRPRGRDAVVLYVSANLEDAYPDDVCRSLHDFHTPWAIKEGCSYSAERGYYYAGRRMLATRFGRVLFRSGYQDPQSVAGVWGDLVVVNELPTSLHWGELMRSSTKSNVLAPIVVGFTAVPPEQVRRNDDLAWYWEEIDDPAKGWKQYVVPVRPETTPHRTEESRRLQIARCRPWERAQRIDAARQGPAPDRRFGNFDDACIFRGGLDDLPGLRPGEVVHIGLGADHGELTGREAWILGAYVERPQDPRAWVLDAYVSQGRTTVDADAHHVAAMLSRRGLDLRRVSRAVGDVNSAGKSSPFRRVNAEFEAAFAALAGGRPPFHIAAAQKGPGSVAFGVRVLDESFGRRDADGIPALMVHEDCEPVLQHVRRWNGAKDETLHVGDSLRYLFVPILGQAWAWGRGAGNVPVTAPIAAVPWASPGLGGRADGVGGWDGSS